MHGAWPDMARRILVTSALPYANGPTHLGHMTETIQCDIWVRCDAPRRPRVHLRLRRRHARHADHAEGGSRGRDAGGARSAASAPSTARISPPSASASTTTTRRTPRRTAASPCACTGRSQTAGHITRRSVRQAYDEKAGMFLPDRYVKGTCPRCSTPDQYGDSCENCGATYSPSDLVDPVSVVSGTTPGRARVRAHLLPARRISRRCCGSGRASGSLQAAVANKLDEWFDAGLRDWDVSRDAPYFGFEIPDAPGKYFYVWLDAPDRLHGELRESAASGAALDLRRMLAARTARRSCTTSSARTSSISTRCSGRRRSRARAFASRLPCTPMAS